MTTSKKKLRTSVEYLKETVKFYNDNLDDETITKKHYEKYRDQYKGATLRGIPFEITFKEWVEWWNTDDRWANRGAGKDKLCMARLNDEGPYRIDNIKCITNSENCKERYINEAPKIKTKETFKRKLEEGIDVFSHLRRGKHPKGKAVKTPDGIFSSTYEAGEYYGISGEGARQRAKHKRKGWSFI